jgi:hypothetical protein
VNPICNSSLLQSSSPPLLSCPPPPLQAATACASARSAPPRCLGGRRPSPAGGRALPIPVAAPLPHRRESLAPCSSSSTRREAVTPSLLLLVDLLVPAPCWLVVPPVWPAGRAPCTAAPCTAAPCTAAPCTAKGQVSLSQPLRS